MHNDFNTAKTIAILFDLRKTINQLDMGHFPLADLPLSCWLLLKTTYSIFLENLLGLQEYDTINKRALVEGLIAQYKIAKKNRDSSQVEAIRKLFKDQNLTLQDFPSRVDWSYKV